MSKRILLVCFALVIGYFAIYFGDGLHVWGVEDLNRPDGKAASGLIALVVVVTLMIALIGVASWFTAMEKFVNNDNRYEARDSEVATFAALALICLACVFGALAAPFTTYSAYPWYWTSKWDILLLLAFVPVAIVIHDIIADIAKARREKKTAKNNVTSIRRDTA